MATFTAFNNLHFMKRLVTLFLLFTAFATACKDKAAPGYVITGKITGLDSGQVYLYNLQNEAAEPDTANIVNGSFEFEGAAEEPRFVFLSLGETLRHQPLGFFLQNGNISINAHVDSLQSGTVTGSAAQDDFKKYQNQFTILSDKQRALIEEYQEADMAGNMNKMMEIQMRFQELEKESKKQIADFVKENPASYVSPFLLAQNYAMDADEEELKPLYNALDEKVKGSFFGKEVGKTLELLEKTSIGAVAPDFTLNNQSGQPVSLSSFKGKYTLIDFWASWCGPCRQENPNIVQAYNTYKPKGFEILGVSLDEKREAWEKAIEQDKLAWTQVSDLKGWQSDAAAQYGIKAIPMNYLLDKEGKIIAKNLRGEDLVAKLKEILN